MGETKGPEIWVVEDDPSARRFIADCLKLHGFNPVLFGNAEKAYAALMSSQMPALMILDILLPGMSGVDLIRLLKQNKTWEKIPVVVVSVLSRGDTPIREALEIVSTAYWVNKPFEVNDLMRTIQEILNCSEVTMAKILVVDDEEHIVMILKDSLEFSGFHVVTAYNGEEALDVVQKDHPDLIVLDIGMPKMDGWEVCRRLKSSEDTKSIPIIILTAYAQMSDKKKGAALGAERFISKPCDLTYLVEEINALLAQKTPKK